MPFQPALLASHPLHSSSLRTAPLHAVSTNCPPPQSFPLHVSPHHSPEWLHPMHTSNLCLTHPYSSWAQMAILSSVILFSWLCAVILFILYFPKHKAVSFADSSFSNQALKVGVIHSSVPSAFLVSLTRYFISSRSNSFSWL